jgi:hypothetical protein
MGKYTNATDAVGAMAEKCRGLPTWVLVEECGTLVFAWKPITRLLEYTPENRAFCKRATQDAKAHGHSLVRVIRRHGTIAAYTGGLATDVRDAKVLQWRNQQGMSMPVPREGEMVVCIVPVRSCETYEIVLRERAMWLIPRRYVCEVCGRRTRRDLMHNDFERVGSKWRYVGVSRHKTCCGLCQGRLKHALLATEETINEAEGTRLESGAKWRR